MQAGVDSRRGIRPPAIGLAWLGLAIGLGASGQLLLLHPPAPQLILLGLTAAVLVAGARVPALRGWAFGLDLRTVVALHLTRFVGAYFIVLLFVIATAARLGLTDPDSMRALLRLPLSLLPTFLVPLIVASHVLIAVRLARPGDRSSS